MEQRKEIQFNPEKQIDFSKLIETLDWEKEITPVDLVKAANKVAGLSGKRKYRTNEASYGLLVKSFEARVSKFTETRFRDKDRFYTLKNEFTRDHILYYAKTGKMLEEVKKELGKKDSKYYTPTIPKSEEPKKLPKKEFPDDEAYMKASIVLGVLAIRGGACSASEFVKARERFGWDRQRSIKGKPHSMYLETNEICTALIDKDAMVSFTNRSVKYEGETEKLESNANELLSLIVDDESRQKVIDYLGELKPKVTVEIKEEILEEPKVEEPKEEDIKPKTQVIAASPEQGRSEFTEIKPVTVPFESSKVKWYKSLIAEAMKGSTRGTYFSYFDLQSIIKKTRFVEINPRDIRNILIELNKQKRGFLRELDFGGFTIGSEAMCLEFYDEYRAENITETIFIRLHMSLDDVQEMCPGLLIKLASEITPDSDNIFEIEMNRSEKAERDFAKLLFKMRPGEIVLESPNNWTLRRAKIIMEKLGLV